MCEHAAFAPLLERRVCLSDYIRKLKQAGTKTFSRSMSDSRFISSLPTLALALSECSSATWDDQEGVAIGCGIVHRTTTPVLNEYTARTAAPTFCMFCASRSKMKSRTATRSGIRRTSPRNSLWLEPPTNVSGEHHDLFSDDV